MIGAARTRILAFTAHGGVGKSTLVNHWLREKASAPYWPEGLAGLQPLYQAMAHDPIAAAVDGLRAASDMSHVPRGLLARAWLRFMEGDREGAKADLDESWQIAERGSMKLYMADILFHRARLFRDRAALEAAAKLIEETGYHRRDEELRERDAQETAQHWPTTGLPPDSRSRLIGDVGCRDP